MRTGELWTTTHLYRYPAVQTAQSLAPIVSMSWGSTDNSLTTSAESIFQAGVQRGVSFFAATVSSIYIKFRNIPSP